MTNGLTLSGDGVNYGLGVNPETAGMFKACSAMAVRVFFPAA